MKIKGQQPLSRHVQKILYDLADRFGKSYARKGDKTWEKHASNIRTIAKEMAHMGYQRASDFKTKTYMAIMEHQKELGSSKSKLESLHATMQHIQTAIGKDGMIPKSISKAMRGSKEYHRSAEDRINPQRWASVESRQHAQTQLEAMNQRYASSAEMARQFGLRKEESLASREIIVKTADGKFMTTAGSRPGELREVNMRGVRYAITDNRKDAMFEKNYLATMRLDQEYLIVKGDWAKGDRTRLVPVLNAEAREAAVRHQKLTRENIALAKAIGKVVDSVIHPSLTKESGYNQYGNALEKVGLTRDDKGHTLHSDRCEFNLRMKAEKNADGKDKWDKHERTLAMGHCDDRKLDAYGG